MFDALRSQTVINLAATALALVTCGLIFRCMRALLRLGQREGTKRIFLDYPNLIHGPQESPDQSGSPRPQS